MAITDLIPWNRNRNMPAPRQSDEHPFVALHREMNRMFDNFSRGLDWPMTTTPGWSVGGWHMGLPSSGATSMSRSALLERGQPCKPVHDTARHGPFASV